MRRRPTSYHNLFNKSARGNRAFTTFYGTALYAPIHLLEMTFVTNQALETDRYLPEVTAIYISRSKPEVFKDHALFIFEHDDRRIAIPAIHINPGSTYKRFVVIGADTPGAATYRTIFSECFLPAGMQSEYEIMLPPGTGVCMSLYSYGHSKYTTGASVVMDVPETLTSIVGDCAVRRLCRVAKGAYAITDTVEDMQQRVDDALKTMFAEWDAPLAAVTPAPASTRAPKRASVFADMLSPTKKACRRDDDEVGRGSVPLKPISTDDEASDEVDGDAIDDAIDEASDKVDAEASDEASDAVDDELAPPDDPYNTGLVHQYLGGGDTVEALEELMFEITGGDYSGGDAVDEIDELPF